MAGNMNAQASTWLSSGFSKVYLQPSRPLSLVALDALVLCTDPNENRHRSDYFRENPVHLINAAPLTTMTATITGYLNKDRVPGTKAAIEKIIKNMFATN